MKISIAMATYNGAQYIQGQLQSFVDQTRQPDELIITDDCSTDQTEAIVREFAKTAPFAVEFHRNEKNLGYCGNFNAALMKTTGDLVFLSDQDDVWFPEKIEHMIEVAERNPQALVVMNDAALTDGELNEVGLTKIGQIKSAGLGYEDFVMGCCCAIRRELLSFGIPIPGGLKAHDGWLVGLADGLGAKVVEDKVLQFYRRHEKNESQVLINRLHKATPLHVYIDLVEKLFGRERRERENVQIDQMALRCYGLISALRNSPEKHKENLREMILKTESRLNDLQPRIEARRKPLHSRLGAICVLVLSGGYKNSSGMKAVFRDLFG